MNRRQLLLLGLLATGLLTFLALEGSRYFTLAALRGLHDDLARAHAEHPWQVTAAFVATCIASTALSLPGATLLTLAAGALFGLWVGLLVSSVAISIGALLAMLSARYLLRDAVAARMGDRLAEIDRRIARDGAQALFALRVVPIFPFFVINLLMGLTALRAWTYFWVTLVGMAVGSFVYVNAGTHLAKVDSLQGLLSPSLLAALALLGVFPLAARALLQAWQTHRRHRRAADGPEAGDGR